jgi:hypothetical protein
MICYFLLLLLTTAQFTIKLPKTTGFLHFAVPVKVQDSVLNLAIDTTDPYHVLYTTSPLTFTTTDIVVPPRVSIARQEEVGPVMSDQFTVGSAAVNSIPFTYIQSPSPLNGVDGILGLGQAITPNQSFLHLLLSQNYISELKFGYSIAATAEFATLDLGFVSHPGPFQFVGSISPSWTVIVNATIAQSGVAVPRGLPINSISFGQYTSTMTEMIGYVHTNIGLTYLPFSIVEDIVSQIRATPNGMFYDIDCNGIAALPELTLKFSTATLKWSGAEYTLKRNDGSCFLAFTVYTSPLIQNSAILGTALLRKYYIAFDRSINQIGFALARTRNQSNTSSTTSRTPMATTTKIPMDTTSSAILLTHSQFIPLFFTYFVFSSVL